MAPCSVCDANTRYQCIRCKIYICNRNFDCHVPVDEDDYDDWQLGRRVALCHRCHDNTQAQVSDGEVQQESSRDESAEIVDSFLTFENSVEFDNTPSAQEGNQAAFLSPPPSTSSHGLRVFEIKCASRGFQVYRDVWNPRMGEKLNVQHEHGNVHDPFALTLSVKRRGSFVEWEVVGHLPREISRFCYYFLNYGGALEGRVRDRKYRASPIPSGGIEVPITLVVLLHKAGQRVFLKMKDLLQEYYVEPEDVQSSSGQHNVARVDANEEFDADVDFEEFQPPEEHYLGEEDAADQNNDGEEDAADQNNDGEEDDDEEEDEDAEREVVGDTIITIDDSDDEVEAHDQNVIVFDE